MEIKRCKVLKTQSLVVVSLFSKTMCSERNGGVNNELKSVTIMRQIFINPTQRKYIQGMFFPVLIVNWVFFPSSSDE